MTVEATKAPADLSSDPEATYKSTVVSSSLGSFDFESGTDELKPPESARSSTAFQFGNLIGRGGFGEVREAVQDSLDRVVAVKSLRGDVVARASESRQELWIAETGFRQEALTMAALPHPGIVPIHDLVWDDNGHLLIVMKYVRGRRWDEQMKEDRESLDREEYLARHVPILIDVAQAVAFAHSRGIVHRDIKPQQVVIGEFGEVILMDWGLAMVYDRDALDDSVSRVGVQLLPDSDSASNPAGTPAFMAPEQTESSVSNIGPWTDVYMLGGTLHSVLTGQPPRVGGDAREVYARAALGEVRSIEQALGDQKTPTGLVRIVKDCLEPEIGKRINDVRTLIQRLEACVVGSDRRDESRKMIAELNQVDLGIDHKYHEHAQMLEKAAMAQVLWPGNPEVIPMREKLSRRLIECAIENGDLALAEFHSLTLPLKCPIAVELRSRVSEARRECARKSRVSWLIAAAGVVAGFMIGMLF